MCNLLAIAKSEQVWSRNLNSPEQVGTSRVAVSQGVYLMLELACVAIAYSRATA